ncbi:MAG: hypothetical protein WAT39_22515, partial [Planctomycetota bacterium]
LPPGRWWSAGRALRTAWLGQRALQLQHGRPPLFPAFFQKWWWLGGGGALYVPAACTDERIEQEVAAAAAGLAVNGSAAASGRIGLAGAEPPDERR